MPYQHGLYSNEIQTSINTPLNVDSGIIVAVGTAPIHLANNPAPLNKPTICYKFSEFVDRFGFSDDFNAYTLCEVAQVAFRLYSIAPVVFINVLDPAKHFDKVEVQNYSVSNIPINIKMDIDTSTVVATSGIFEEVEKFESDIDFEVRTDEVEDLDEGTTDEVITLHILNGDKVTDNKIKISYRTMATALGGTPVETEVTLTGLIYELPSDTVISSVAVESGGVDTLKTLVKDSDYALDYSDGVLSVTILDDTNISDDSVDLKFNMINPEKVTADDIIGGVDPSTNFSTGLELVEAVYQRFSIVPGILIAPRFSKSSTVAAALIARAKNVSGMFPSVAVVDIDAKNYSDAVEFKNASNLNDSHLIVCYPKVAVDGVQYNLSTHLAALMNRVDTEIAGGIPYISPSNQTLQIDAAILDDGTELYLTRDQANLLNANGICTAFNFNGWKFWGNRTAAYPNSSDPRENFIPVRRMFNFINSTFLTTYISALDMPINRRRVEAVLNSANIYLNGLVSRGCLLGGRIEFADADNATSDLMDGILRFHLYITPPSPARSLTFLLEYDPDYLESVFG